MAGRKGAPHGRIAWNVAQPSSPGDDKDISRGELRLMAEVLSASSETKVRIPGAVFDRAYDTLRMLAGEKPVLRHRLPLRHGFGEVLRSVA